MVRKEAVKNLYSNSSEMKNVINSYLNNSRYLMTNLGLPTFVRTLKPYVYFESVFSDSLIIIQTIMYYDSQILFIQSFPTRAFLLLTPVHVM